MKQLFMCVPGIDFMLLLLVLMDALFSEEEMASSCYIQSLSIPVDLHHAPGPIKEKSLPSRKQKTKHQLP